MPTGVTLFVWLPEERAERVEMRGQAGPRDPRHVRAMSADLDKVQAEGVELSTAATASNQLRYPIGQVLGTNLLS